MVIGSPPAWTPVQHTVPAQVVAQTALVISLPCPTN